MDVGGLMSEKRVTRLEHFHGFRAEAGTMKGLCLLVASCRTVNVSVVRRQLASRFSDN